MLNPYNELRIFQNNLHKHKERTHGILSDSDMKDYAILLLQEPYWDTYKTSSSPLHRSWTLFQPPPPTDQPNAQPRVAIYTNNNLLSPAQISEVHLPFSDAIAIQITSPSQPLPTLIINIYNPSDHPILTELHNYLITHIQQHSYDTVIMAGDFNCHHPLWNPQGYIRHDEQGDILVELAADLGLELLIPPGTVTYPEAQTAIDLVWGNENAAKLLIQCGVTENHDTNSDHYTIRTTLSLPTEPPNKEVGYDFSKTNWTAFKEKLTQCLAKVNLSTPIADSICSPEDLDSYTANLVNSISMAIDGSTPRKASCPHSKRWWLKSLTKLRRETNRLRKVYKRTKHEIDRKAWRERANEYTAAIRKAKEDKWRVYVENADDKSIWNIKNFITNIPTQSFIPTLENNASTHEQKIALLQQSFFPPPPPADLKDISYKPPNNYPLPAPLNTNITLQQIRRAVDKAPADKAPGPDGITNRVIKNALPIIEEHLQVLMQASINLSHFPKAFKSTTTVVLRKPEKPDYTKAKAYRPIALESALGKILESVITELLSYLTETYGLLPAHHFGGRPGRSAEDAMLILSENIHQAWKEGKVFTAIYLDVAGAFNNVHHQRLINNLRRRQIPPTLTNWIQSFLQDRSTQLHFNGCKSPSIPTLAGVPQGSPLSPLLYMFYNADLLDITDGQDNAFSLGFIDDVVYGVKGMSDTGNVRKLKQILQKAEVWRKKHGAQFEPSKYVMVHYTRNYRRSTKASITINRTHLQPSNEARYLGVIFDQKLNFKSHLQHAAKKGTSAALAVSSISKSSWGAPYKYIRRIFQSVICPRTDYAAIIWHRPKHNGNIEETVQIRKLTTIQRLSMKAILGCYRTTPTLAMEIESGLLPPSLRLQTRVLSAATRMQSLSASHPIQQHIHNALRSRTANITHRSNLENIFQQVPFMTTKVESIEPFIRPPWWMSPAILSISPTKEDAVILHDKLQKEASKSKHTMTVYTDGSGINGKIGAAACNATTNKTSHQHLGTEIQYNVYSAELSAIYIALSQWKATKNQFSTCRIYADAQNAAKSIINPQRQSGQSLIKPIVDLVDNLMAPGSYRKLEIVWIPGHYGIPGNERADENAKKAASDPSISIKIPYSPLKSCRIQQIKKLAQSLVKERWEKNMTSANHLRRILVNEKVKRGPKLYNSLPSRKSCARLVQLRTGHCGLNKYLHRFGKRGSPYCECGYARKESVEHYIMECPRFKEERKVLRKKVGAGKMRLRLLLGDEKIVRHTLDFVKETGRLNY
jgi:ribonuclease HI